MQFFPPGKFRRLSTILVAMTLVALLTFWILRTYLAERAGQKPALSSLQFAARLDPSNSDYQLRLGRFYEYDPANTDPGQAMAHLERAVELNPYDPQTWLELGAAHEFQGQTGQAEACLRRADFLAPNLPPVQWAIANFFLLHGNVDEAFRHFKVVLAGSTTLKCRKASSTFPCNRKKLAIAHCTGGRLGARKSARRRQASACPVCP